MHWPDCRSSARPHRCTLSPYPIATRTTLRSNPYDPPAQNSGVDADSHGDMYTLMFWLTSVASVLIASVLLAVNSGYMRYNSTNADFVASYYIFIFNVALFVCLALLLYSGSKWRERRVWAGMSSLVVAFGLLIASPFVMMLLQIG